jgi:hypothetical protein
MRVHPRGLLVLAAFVAALALGLDARLGLLAIVAAGVIDWMALIVPLSGATRDRRAR